MRIVGGLLRGTALAAVGTGDPAAHLRPTTDRVRESLFNILTQGRGGDLVTGRRVLDLFAGTGAMGLEALSRGAETVTFVENGRAAQALLGRNIDLCHARGAVRVLRADATRLPPGTPHDLLFLDPPYGRGLGPQALAAAARQGWLAPGARVVWEEGGAVTPPVWLQPDDRRRFGGTHVLIATVVAPVPPPDQSE